MGITASSSHETAAQTAASPTHNDTGGDLASTAITNVTPSATIKRNSTRASKSLQSSFKTPHHMQNHHVRQASVRNRAAIPMPDHSELDKRFAKVLVRHSHIHLYIYSLIWRRHLFNSINNEFN